MLKLVAFDLDGTIADTIPMCLEAFEKSVSPYAGHTLTKDEILQTFGLNEIGMIKAIVKDQWEKALSDFYIKYEELHCKCNVPYDGMIPLIEMLKNRGIIVALITGKGQKSCEITLQNLKMQALFSDIMTGNEHKNCKDEALFALMKQYSLSPQECVYIGDAVSDVAAANKVGIKCLSASWCESADREALLEVNGENVYESVSDLAGALSAWISDHSKSAMI